MTCGCGYCTETKRNTDVAVDELRRKIALENTFQREIRSAFRRMAGDFRISVAATGSPQPANKYVSTWEATLQGHYERVQKSFRDEVALQNGKKSLRWWYVKQETTDEIIQLALLAWRDDTAPVQASEITRTNQREMESALNDARNQMVEDGDTITNASLAAAAAAILQARLAGRVNLIAMTETQHAAESTKQITAEGLAGVRPFPLRNQVFEPGRPIEEIQQRDVTKTWRTVGDSRVRQSHRQENGSTVKVNQPFILEGYQLKYPGDPSSAPIQLWINCRCSSEYNVNNG
ncbi:MAG: putative capsid protein [Prokaryotic dsDNA virus sp.]|nr:MAG: putative capsid protein [Prokaryotic dsDNA virus sp.]|tara:strand:- start:7856 stop:8728 length:873 start_codon:yes stop_codon:yes gene_type:complete